jgi:hypothetical protein
MVAWRIVALVVLGAVACERRPAPPCAAGASVACTCIGSLTGTQTCQPDGTLSVCLCAPPAAARVEAQEVPTPITLTPTAAESPPPPQPSTSPTAPVAVPAGATPMDQARACLRSNASNMAAGNACVLQVLRGRATSESELGLLAVTYRAMGRSSDAVRAMRAYVQRFPDGPRVTSFQQYIDNNSN